MDLKSIREALNFSTTEVAIRLGVSQSTVVRLEQSAAKGTISINSLKKIAAAMNLQIEIKASRQPGNRKSHHGLKRIDRRTSRRSKLSRAMKDEDKELERSLSPEKRILRACRLSDFARGLK